METYPPAYPALRRLSDPWYRAWFARDSAGVFEDDEGDEPFFEASAGVRENLYRCISRDECLLAANNLRARTGRSLRSLSTMYAFADYFEDQFPGISRASRGALWSNDLSNCLAASDRMIKEAVRFGAAEMQAFGRSWIESIGVYGAMFFPQARHPRTWRMVARRRLRAEGMTAPDVAVLEAAWLRPIDVAALAGDEPSERYPFRPLATGTDPYKAVEERRSEALKALAEKAPSLPCSPRVLVRIVDAAGVRFGAVDADDVPHAWRGLTFEPLSPLPKARRSQPEKSGEARG